MYYKTARWIQPRLNNEEWEAEAEENFGDGLCNKEEATTRIAFLNIGGISLVNAHQRNQKIRLLVRVADVNILGLAETNVNWTHIHNHKRLHK